VSNFIILKSPLISRGHSKIISDIFIHLADTRFQRRRQAETRHKMLLEQEVQLSRLRHTDDSALTNFNPNYGCDGILNGGNIDVKNLPQVARESLRLVK
jgi:anaplastic lymphoma kinase